MQDERPLKKKSNNKKKETPKKDKTKDKKKKKSVTSDKSTKRKHDEKEVKKKQPKKPKKEEKEEPTKLQDETSILLNALVTKLPEDNAQVSTAIISRVETSSSSSESSSSMDEEEANQQIVPYQQQKTTMVNAAGSVIDMNSVNATKLLDCVKSLLVDSITQRDEMVKYAKKKATNKAMIEVARLNGDHKASKLEGRLEFALEEIKKKEDEITRKDKRIATLESELKKKDENANRNQRTWSNIPSIPGSVLLNVRVGVDVIVITCLCW